MYNLNRGPKPLLISIPISALLLLTLSFSPETHLRNTLKSPTKHTPHLHIHKHYQIAHSACKGTLYPKLCVSTVASFPDLTSKSLPQIISSTVNHTMSEVRASSANYTVIEKRLRSPNPLQKRALDDCLELLDDTISELEIALADLTSIKTVSKHYHDLQTLLSAAITNQDTCLGGFDFGNGTDYVRNYIEKRVVTISKHVSNILVMLKKIPGKHHSTNYKTTSSEVFPEYGHVENGFPTWVSFEDQNLLQAQVNETKFALVVAKDGTGNFTTVSEAVAAAPNSSDTRSISFTLT